MSTGLKANSDGSAAIQVGGTDVITLTSGGAATFVTSPTTVQAGTAAAPSITFSGDTNTGIYSPGADTIAFTEGGVESMRLNSSGNMGLGVTPSAWSSAFGPVIQVKTGSGGGALTGSSTDNFRMFSNTFYDGAYKRIASGFATQYEQASGTHVWYTAGTSSANSTISFTQAMTLDASGNLGIGTSSPGARLDVVTAGGFSVGRFGNGTTQVGIGVSSDNTAYIEVTQAQPLRFLTNGTDRARITSDGRFFLGLTSTSDASTLNVRNNSTNNICAILASTISGDVGTAQFYISKYDNNSTTSQIFAKFIINQGATASGQINANGASQAAFGSWSDSRLKENITDLPPQLDKFLALRPVEFDYIESEGGGHQIGFVAQEVNEIFPDLVGEREDGMLTLSDMNKNDARLIKAFQELAAKVTALEAEIAALKGNA